MSIVNLAGFQPGQAVNPIAAQLQAARPANPIGDTSQIAFQDILGAYMNIVGDAGRMEQQAQHLQIEFALGNHDDMLSVILAQEMAFTSMNFAVQITSRMIEAYREIMRMQL